jgi:hypothetical protein
LIKGIGCSPYKATFAIEAGLGVEKHHLPEEAVALITDEKHLFQALELEEEEPEDDSPTVEEALNSDEKEEDYRLPTSSAAAAEKTLAKQV